MGKKDQKIKLKNVVPFDEDMGNKVFAASKCPLLFCADCQEL